MKYILQTLFALLMPFTALAADAHAQTEDNRIITAPMPEEHLLDNKIYFFAHSMCMNCQEPFNYLMSNHRDLNIPITDMKFHHNFELYKECVQKFNISNKELRLPLICMGNHYIMGWDGTAPSHFEEVLKDFQQTYPSAQ